MEIVSVLPAGRLQTAQKNVTKAHMVWVANISVRNVGNMKNVTMSLGIVLESVNMVFTVQTATSNVHVSLIQNVTRTMEHVGAPWVLLTSGVVQSVLRGNLVTNVNLTAHV